MAVLFQYYTAPTACLAPPPRPQIARLTNVLDEAAGRVVRVELLALQLDARRGRGVVGLEPKLDGAALVRMVSAAAAAAAETAASEAAATAAATAGGESCAN